MRSRIQSPKYRQKRRKKAIAVIFLSVLGMLALSSSFLFAMRMPFFQISEVEVVGASGLPQSFFQEKAMASLESSNIFFFSKKKMEESLIAEFREIEDMSISRSGFSKLKISVKERVPTALVCAGFREEKLENSDCYLADAGGYVFEKASKPYPEWHNLYYVPSDKGGVKKDIARFPELQKFIDGAAAAGVPVQGILIGDGGEYEMYVNPDTTVYFDDRSPFDDTLSNLLVFWQNASKNATSTPSFNYINLRFGNAIYYRD
ncbi:MAG: FtsQ-type POTRA domain-containing protein [bacterium]|nr:FtsQ-type POTRA domain-containing protein [bacterium]